MFAGGGECLSASYPQYLQCAFGVSNFLAYLCYHGSTAVCWKISQGELQGIFSYTGVTRYTKASLTCCFYLIHLIFFIVLLCIS